MYMACVGGHDDKGNNMCFNSSNNNRSDEYL